jgi:hypothetical protein
VAENARVQRLEALFRKELNTLRSAGANARFWESLAFPCSEAAAREAAKRLILDRNILPWTLRSEG